MTHTTPRNRPWYVPDRLADDYCEIARSGGDLRMLKTLKILRSILVNVGIIGITAYTLLFTTADPTVVFIFGIGILGGYNGIEVADYAALATAFAEVRQQQTEDGTDDSP
ncbi:hypothetical protein [Haloarcula montana]|uniref:hypothetical protein n=1 Tax=Haloarcula montana TaxID=3111776 RepID=UPI002D76A7D5|nr:hypothetical protein [Haloarcula sp. GH36]